MVEPADNEARHWLLKRESGPSGSEDVQQLSESQLYRVLRRAGDHIAAMSVKQGESDWYPAKVVLSKFEQLAQEGIYVREAGKIDGPFTAAKTIEVLQDRDLTQVQAKVGIHADWIPAERLLQKLLQIKEHRTDDHGPSIDEIIDARIILENLDDDDIFDVEWTDQDDPPETVDEGVVAAQIDEGNTADSQPIDNDVAVELIEDPPAIELVMVAEPVGRATPTQPATPTVQRPIRQTSTQRRSRSHGDSARRHWILLGLLGAAGLLVASVVVAAVLINRDSTDAIAGSDGTPATEAVTDSDADVTAAADNEEAPPEVREGMLYRPSFDTRLGQAEGGILFSARVGRSNRMVLVGAANLLGPARGLRRQLRGPEVLIHWRGLDITDCVSQERRSPKGEPLRLRTQEYPLISVHGDALVFEPESQIGLDPLAVASTLPQEGDRVWLLAPIAGSSELVHPGRWIGNKEDWLVYRLDNQALNLQSASGGAVVNVDHQVVGIHVATEAAPQGTTAIASPIKAIIPEIQ